MTFERRLLGSMIIKSDENKVELSEGTQKILYKIEYYRQKVLSVINNPIIKIPLRIFWLIILMSIAVVANYGAYSTVNTLMSGSYTVEGLKYFYRIMWIMNQLIWILPVFVYYCILSTVYNIIKDIVEYKR